MAERRPAYGECISSVGNGIRWRHHLQAALCCGFLLSLATSVHAQLVPYRITHVEGSVTNGGSYYLDGTTSISGAAFDTRANALAISEAMAEADIGRLATAARGDSFVIRTPMGSAEGSGAFVESVSRWGDQVTITSPSRQPGSPGKFKGFLSVDGTLSNSGSPYFSIANIAQSISIAQTNISILGTGIDINASWNACKDHPQGGAAFGNIACAGSFNNTPNGDIYNYNNLGSLVDAEVRFVFGEPVEIHYFLVVVLRSGAGTFSSVETLNPTAKGLASVDLSQTLLWGGITEVVDDSDLRVDDFSLTSLSGFDYVKGYGQPVPGPLPWLGAGAAYRFSRKLRTRLHSSKHRSQP